MENLDEFSDYIRLTEGEARAKAEAEGRRCRVVIRDGKAHIRTADLDFTRLNVAVDNGVVTSVVKLG